MRISLRRFIYLLLLAVLAFTLTSACSRNINYSITSPKQLREDCQVVQHAMGKTCIPRHPQQVVTLWMATFRSTLALGTKPIATAWYAGDSFPEHLQDKADGVENIGFQPNLERILLLKPDLILSTTRFKNIYKQLSDIAPTVVLDNPSPPPPWQKHLEDVAKVLDKELESKQLIKDYWQRIEQLKQALGDRRLQMQVSVATVDRTYGIYTYGIKHPTGALLNDVGLQRPPAQSGVFFTKDRISQENLSDIDGDVLFLSYREEEAGKKAIERLQKDPLWQKLNVVQRNRVYLVDSAHWYAFDILAMNAVIDDLFKYLVN
ncbi:iron-siderophore ABC transporter substrate-binding protein [Chroococcidiopsis sp. CCALA 051]|uniref:iron-siderophore ABC transporter substrate-binding protein n=1 Tax=Chroococcidiopsis sp. CCALA 051 TaxID=869949 RepID=UPI000D05C8F7|nr:iron-siderophore ABC transporter substrate-binding protein [Chroococcidiopsis sp. CCALA 051]PSB41278.1 iron-siderophore ABC transporter substrate-binding protein [Cyanosarcina cf. burmensis CCALA 770]PSM45465.1 iron-siderophore ABC transporter substrate-binding protein [Chroococcidiopsis sp. CCALA 051]